MTERFNANAEDTVNTSSSGGPSGSGQNLVALGVGQGSGQTASRQENNASIGFEFPIRWDDVTDTLGRLGEKKYLGEFVDDMEMRDKLIEDYLTTSVVNGVVGGDGIDVSKSQGVVSLSITPPYLQLLCPVGTIHAYPGYSAPLGWLLCDGSSTAGYPALASLVGATTPNLKGKVISGYNPSETEFDNMFETGGAKTVTLTSAESGVPAHAHANSASFSGAGGTTDGAGSHTHTTNTSSGPSASHGHSILDRVAHGPSNQNVTYTAGVNSTEANHQHTFTPAGTVAMSNVNNTAADAASAHNNLQPYMTLNYIIKRDYI